MIDSLNNTKILYIDSDKNMFKHHIQVLEYFSKEIIHVSTSRKAKQQLSKDYFDIIILDVDLDDGDGLELAAEIREEDKDVILIITSYNTDFNNLRRSLAIRALDYLVKPLNFVQLSEVLEKCVSIFKRDNSRIEELADNLLFDWGNKELITDSSTINLTKKEILFLEQLIENRGKIITYEKISSVLYSNKENNISNKNSIKNTVFRLKKRIKKEFIRNVPGLGYYVL